VGAIVSVEYGRSLRLADQQDMALARDIIASGDGSTGWSAAAGTGPSQRGPSGATLPLARPSANGGEASILRIVIPLAIILVGATIVCFWSRFVLARQADDRVEAGHRQGTGGAVEALQALPLTCPARTPESFGSWRRLPGSKGCDSTMIRPTGDRESANLARSPWPNRWMV